MSLRNHVMPIEANLFCKINGGTTVFYNTDSSEDNTISSSEDNKESSEDKEEFSIESDAMTGFQINQYSDDDTETDEPEPQTQRPNELNNTIISSLTNPSRAGTANLSSPRASDTVSQINKSVNVVIRANQMQNNVNTSRVRTITHASRYQT